MVAVYVNMHRALANQIEGDGHRRSERRAIEELIMLESEYLKHITCYIQGQHEVKLCLFFLPVPTLSSSNRDKKRKYTLFKQTNKLHAFLCIKHFQEFASGVKE